MKKESKELSVFARARIRSDAAYVSEIVRNFLTADLLLPKYKKDPSQHPMAGFCFVASEAAYWLLGRKWTPMRAYYFVGEGFKLPLEKDSHWWLENKALSLVLDITADQFWQGFAYERGKPKSRFNAASKRPTRRAVVLLKRIYDAILLSSTPEIKLIPLWLVENIETALRRAKSAE